MSIAKKAAPPHARVSVIIPARNARQSIGETLGSLVSETPLIEEILLVDDSSTDGTASFAEAEGKRLGLPVRVLQAGARGTGAARNAGLDAALAPFIYFIDADDLLAAGGLTALKDRLDANPDSGLALGTYVRNVDGKRERIERPAGYSSSKAANARGIIEGLSPSIAIGSILIRRNVIGKVRFPEGIAYDEDTIFFAAVLADTPVVFTENIVCVYNVNSERAESRFSIQPQKAYLGWRRALQPLLGNGLDRKVSRLQPRSVSGTASAPSVIE